MAGPSAAVHEGGARGRIVAVRLLRHRVAPAFRGRTDPCNRSLVDHHFRDPVFPRVPTIKQMAGMAVIFLAFFAFTIVGRREGIRFHRDKSVFFMIAATLLGAASALYDKYLLQAADLSPGQVQAWFSVYTCVLLIPPMWLWLRMKDRHPFHWHWAIPVIGITLLLADILYFTAISRPDALISLISPMRRTSVVVSFLLGILIFREKQILAKGLCVAAIVVGVLLLS